MADFHAADLWVAVIPETSQVGPAMEEAGKQAKGKFGDAVKGIGKNIHDEFDQIGQKAKDAFGKAGKTAGEVFSSEIGKELTNTAAAEIGKALSETVKELPGVSRGVELFHSWADASVQARNGIQGVADAMNSAKAGDFAGALAGVDRTLKSAEPIAKNLGIDISGWSGDVTQVLSPLGEFKGKSDEAKDSITGIADTFSAMPGKVGKVGEALAGWAGPIGAAVAGLQLAEPIIDRIDEKIRNSSGIGKFFEDHSDIEGASGGVADMLGADRVREWLGKHLGYDPNMFSHSGTKSPDAGGSGTSSTPLPGGVEPYPEHFIGPIPYGAVRAPNGVAPPGTGTSTPPNVYKSWYGSGAGASHSGNWDAVAGPEAGGNWHIDHGEGPDVTGGLQIATQTWLANGGGAFAPKAYMATPEQQKTIGDRVLATQGPGAWPTTSKNHPDWFKGGGGGSGPGSMAGLAGGLNLETIPLAAQKYANDCIDASARIILSHSGVNMSEDQLKSVIAPGGTIDSQAAGMNRLFPAGAWRAMQGSGGSPAAMFAAIKASIDNGTGSILNVAPGSSIGGRNFSEGHFIAATGYNPDGTINLSDTAKGTKYSVSASDAFQATRGRGIVAGTGSGPGAITGADRSSAIGQIPTGAEHDPLYVTTPSSGSGGGKGSSPFESQGQQLGQGLLGGIMQSLGLDGSVFGGKSPLDWGAVKLGGGLLNYGMGLMNRMGGGPMGTPGMGGGGGGGLLSGLAGMIPGAGAAISAAAGPGGGSYGIGQQAGGNQTTVNHDQSINITANGGDPYGWLRETQWARNANIKDPNRSNSYLSNVPVPAQ